MHLPPGEDLVLKSIINTNTPTMATAEINARHFKWNSKNTNARGAKLNN